MYGSNMHTHTQVMMIIVLYCEVAGKSFQNKQNECELKSLSSQLLFCNHIQP